jgi:phosphatidylethanolamine-binding protein (PEBP) family uncharacterized protein
MLLAVSLLSVLALTSMNSTRQASLQRPTRTRTTKVPSVYKLAFEEVMQSKKSSEEEDTAAAVYSVSDSGTGFTLQSSSFAPNGYLPSDYTCLDPVTGGISPHLNWVYPPMETQQYMIVMWSHHVGYTCDRYEWVLYGIDASFTQLKAGNPNGVGTVGGTYPGAPKYIYSPPCATGTGNKTYEFTIYALREDLAPYVETADVSDDVRYAGPYLVKTALDNKLIIDTATIAVQYNSERGPPPPIDGASPSLAPTASPSASPTALPSVAVKLSAAPTRRPYASAAPSMRKQSMSPSAQPSSSGASPAVPAVEDGDAAVSTDVDDPRGPDPNAPQHPDEPVDEPDNPGPGPDVHPVEPVAEPDAPGPGPDVHPDVGFVEVVSEKPVIPPAEQADMEQEVAEPDVTDAGTDAPADAAVADVAAAAAVAAVQEVSKEVALSEAAHHAVVHATTTAAAAAANAKKSQTNVRRRAAVETTTTASSFSYPLMTSTLMGRNGVPYDLPFDYAADDEDMMECV